MKIQLNLQTEFIDKKHCFNDDQEAYKKIQEIYNAKLKESRTEVCEFFKIKKSPELSMKIILRLFILVNNT